MEWEDLCGRILLQVRYCRTFDADVSCKLLSDVASSLNFCGNSEDHCGYGCQPGFGTCHEQATDSSKQISRPEDGLEAESGGNSASNNESASSTLESPSATDMNESPKSSTQLSACPSESAETVKNSDGESETHAKDNGYIKTFKGKGMVSAEGWPSKDKWLSFERFWTSNLGIMKQSCQNWNQSWAQNSETEIATMRSSIEEVAAETNLDKTFIAAIMMQESNGCTRVHTTYGTHPNPGLFQSHNGTGSCNDRPFGPCPQAEILQMVKDGAAGTTQGDGLKQCLEKSKGGTDVIGDEATYYYQAARRYNSGSLAPDGDLGHGGATPCYCSDVANRLIGWSNGTSSCTSETIQ